MYKTVYIVNTQKEKDRFDKYTLNINFYYNPNVKDNNRFDNML